MKKFNADYGDVKPTEGGGYVINDKGPFLAKVVKAEPFMSKSGNPSVKVDYRIVGGKYDTKEIRFQNVTFLPKAHKWAGLSLHVLKQLRQPFEGAFEVDPSKWVGRYVYITLGVEDDLKGVPRNKVTNLKAPSIQELTELDEAPAQWQLLEAKQNGTSGSKDGEAIVNQAKAKAKAAPKPEPEEDEVPF